MKYINQLQEENARLKHQIEKTRDQIKDFKEFLYCPKFVGFESDGARKDWIATDDVYRKLRELEIVLLS